MFLIRIWVTLLLLLPSFIFPRQIPDAKPDQLIQTVNGIRTSRGLPALRDNSNPMVAPQYAINSLSSGQAAPTSTPEKPTSTNTLSATEFIVPIIHSTPDDQGRIYHIVRQGQTLWYIAISYGTKINAIQQANNMSPDDTTVFNGEKLLIPTSLTPLPTLTLTPAASATPQETFTPLAHVPQLVGTEAPSPTPTIDPNEQAAADERFRGGLFIALVISIVLIVAGFLLNRR